MGAIDVSKLLEPISDESPCGDDLEYDLAFTELETLAKGTPEVEIGDVKRPAEEPNWKQVRDASMELCERTRDLRVGIYLVRALTRLEGLTGLRDGLSLLAGWIERYWDTVHPQLDPEDPDPIFRTNTLSQLNDQELFIHVVRTIPLTNSRQLGRFTYRDLQLARGEIKHAENGKPEVDAAVIEGAFAQTETEELQAAAAAAGEAIEHVKTLVTLVDGHVGASSGVNLRDLQTILSQVQKELQSQLAKRGYGDGSASAEGAASTGDAESSVPGTGGGGGGPGAGPGAPLTGEIRSRQDVLLALDKICNYYHSHEPSSPVPLLLKRAQRLVPKSFMDIIKDLSPDAMAQVEVISGESDDSTDD